MSTPAKECHPFDSNTMLDFIYVDPVDMMAVRWCRRYRPHIRTLLTLCIVFTITILLITVLTGDSSVDSDGELLPDQSVLDLAKWKLRHPRPVRKHKGNKLITEDDGDDEDIQICKVPRLTLEGDANSFAYHPMPPLECTGYNLMYIQDGQLHINKTVLGKQELARCEYRGIEWISDAVYSYTEVLVIEKPPYEIKVEHDFMRIECFLKREDTEKEKLKAEVRKEALDHFMEMTNSTDGFEEYYYDTMRYMYQQSPDFDQFIVQTTVKQEVLNRMKSVEVDDTIERMNVLIIALDSMSHLCYQRKLPKTYDYIQKKLHTVILDGYNIVGDATTAAIVPLLTGKLMQELPEVRHNVQGSTYVDIYPFVWNKFEQQGYVTMYGEDQPSLGTFNLRMNGFEEIPTDHYMRPFWMAQSESSLRYDSQDYCLGGSPHHEYMLDYVKDFFRKYAEVPKFAFSFMGELSHHDNNPVEYVDDDIVALLEDLRKEGHLENTLVVVMGDHGARYSKVRQTVQGKLEERLPMMSLAYPQRFKTKHPKLMANLRNNAMGLSTPFDMHETLKDVLNHQKKPAKTKNNRAVSLLRPIKVNRTCTSAGVELHWCTCLHWQSLPKDDKNVVKAVPLIVEKINELTYEIRDQCHKLTLKRVHDIKMITPNEKVLKFTKSIDADQRIANFSTDINMDVIHFQIIVETSPNNGMFEATVHLDNTARSFIVHPDISRINQYGSQPHCILDSAHVDLRKYCYCRTQPAASTKAMDTHRKAKKKGSKKP